jgi:hypothetical protein
MTALSRAWFLGFAGLVALVVGGVALVDPAALLDSKGVHGNAAAAVWMREVGVALVAIGFIALSVRSHPDSPTLRAFMWGNALLQCLLLPVEILAFVNGTVPSLTGIVPNSILHVLLGMGFFAHARAMVTGRPLTTP